MKNLSLQQRADTFNTAYAHLPFHHLTTHHDAQRRSFITGDWFVGGGNISDFYGSYQVEYLKRMEILFSDISGKPNFVHLFAGSIPISPCYTVVGLPDKDYKPELECDAHELSSRLPFNPELILADPPYKEASMGQYRSCEINGPRVLDECIRVLKPNGFVVWMDECLPTFSNDVCRRVGSISYIRSTGNRFRVVSIFQKHQKK